MNRRTLVLAVGLLVVVGIAGGLKVLSSGGGERAASLALGPGAAAGKGVAASEDAELAESAARSTGSEDPEALDRRSAAPRPEAASNAAGRELVVRLTGASPQADPELAVVAVPTAALEELSTDEWLEASRSGDGVSKHVRVPVGSDGIARLALPRDAKEVSVFVDGRFLFAREPLEIDVEDPNLAQGEETLTADLEVVLGGSLRLAWAGERDVPESGDITLMGGSFNGGGRGWSRRRRSVSAGEAPEWRALDPELSWTLMPKLDDAYAYTDMGLTVEPGRETTVEVEVLAGVAVEGVVRDGSGAPVEGATVTGPGGTGWWGGGGAPSAETDAEGRYALSGLGPGEVELRVSKEGWRDARGEKLELADGERRVGIDVVLERGARIAGRVLQDGEVPVENALVVVQGMQQRGGWGGFGGGARMRRLGEARTDATGQFTVSGLPDGQYTVRARYRPDEDLEDEDDDAGGGSPAGPMAKPAPRPASRAVATEVRTGTLDLRLDLLGARVFSGRVVDDLGEPLTSFTVRAESTEPGGPEERQSFEDAVDGRFAFDRVGPGAYSVRVTAESHVGSEPQVLELPENASTEVPELAFSCTRSASLAGRVVDAVGAPVAGARVRASDGSGGGNPWGGPRGPRAETDAGGAFLFESLNPGTQELTASHPDWADSEPLAVELLAGADPEAQESIELRLRTGGRIEGVVSSPEGDPLVGRRVSWGSNAMGFGNRDETTSDSAGRFVFEHVTPGDWSVSAAPSMRDMGKRMRGRGQNAWAEVMGELLSQSVSVADGETTEVLLGGEPRRPVRVYGVVTRDGEPLPEAQVFAVSEGSAVFQGMKTSTTAIDGSFELTVDRPGAYVVSARANRLGVELPVDVPREDEVRVDLEVPVAGISGRVERPDGRPAAGLRLSLEREDGMGRMRWGGDQATTDDEGHYLFESLEAGTYTVRANVAGWAGGNEESYGAAVRSGVDVQPKVVTGGVDFRLEPGGRVEGSVRAADGSAVSDASVFFRDAEGHMITRVSGTVTNASGRFEREGLAPGRYTLSVRSKELAAGDASASVVVRSGETAEVELVVETGITVLVTLESEDEALPVRAQVFDSDGREVGGLVTRTALRASFNEGFSSREAKIGPLPPGRYVVRATTREGEVVERKVRLRARQTEKKVKLELD